MEAFTEQTSIWCCHLGTFCCTIFKKKKGPSTIVYLVTLWPAVCAVGVLFILNLEFSIRNMSCFLDDVHIVKVLNEPVDDSGSEGGVLETEYSPSESDPDSRM